MSSKLQGVIAAIAISALYRYGPSRERAEWRWVSWGSAVVTLVWIVGPPPPPQNPYGPPAAAP